MRDGQRSFFHGAATAMVMVMATCSVCSSMKSWVVPDAVSSPALGHRRTHLRSKLTDFTYSSSCGVHSGADPIPHLLVPVTRQRNAVECGLPIGAAKQTECAQAASHLALHGGRSGSGIEPVGLDDALVSRAPTINVGSKILRKFSLFDLCDVSLLE
jgi:hypothetical protein